MVMSWFDGLPVMLQWACVAALLGCNMTANVCQLYKPLLASNMAANVCQLYQPLLASNMAANSSAVQNTCSLAS